MPYSTGALISSSETTFSTSMRSRADGPSDLSSGAEATTADTQDWLRELDHACRQLVRHALADAQNTPTAQQGSMLAVARLIPGMDKSTWEQLRNQLPQHGWCALEICVHTADATICSTSLADCLPQGSESDPLTGALLAAPLLQQLEREMARSARGQSPLSVAALSLDPRWTQLHGHHAVHTAALTLARAFQSRGLCCDSLGRLGVDHFALILPGASLFKAQVLVEDLLSACLATEVPVHFLAGIAGGNSFACCGAALLEQASLALKEAMDYGETLRVYRPPAHPLTERLTLVQSHEKRFLFSGGE